uniref:Phage P2 GpU n=1 Tax=Candidatus Kentrum sp. TC TaxID=2126339 RepID=A0A450YW55_9GAMM|nr:MAG: Phage P2 GpU [Candidatus Kentron sp. TC]
MNYAILGDIRFEIRATGAMDARMGVEYAEHPRIEGKPRRQFVGDRADQWRIAMRFSRTFCDPDREFARLEAAMSDHAPLPFVLESGGYKGDFVLSSLSLTLKKTDRFGNAILSDVELTLDECVPGPGEERAANAGRAIRRISGWGGPGVEFDPGARLSPTLLSIPSGPLASARAVVSSAARFVAKARDDWSVARGVFADADRMRSNPMIANADIVTKLREMTDPITASRAGFSSARDAFSRWDAGLPDASATLADMGAAEDGLGAVLSDLDGVVPEGVDGAVSALLGRAEVLSSRLPAVDAGLAGIAAGVSTRMFGRGE